MRRLTCRAKSRSWFCYHCLEILPIKAKELRTIKSQLTFNFSLYCLRSFWVTVSSSSWSLYSCSAVANDWACSSISFCIYSISVWSSSTCTFINFLISARSSYSVLDSSRIFLKFTWLTTAPREACSYWKRGISLLSSVSIFKSPMIDML